MLRQESDLTGVDRASPSGGGSDDDEEGQRHLGTEPPRRVREPWYLAKPHAWKRLQVQAPWRFPMAAMNIAARIIQRNWQACWLRFAKPTASSGDGKAALAQRMLATSLQASRKATVRYLRRPTGENPIVAAQLRRRYFEFLKGQCTEAASGQRRRPVGVTRTYDTYEDFVAAIIQGRWRASHSLRLLRRICTYQVYKYYHVAAFEIQRAWRWFQDTREARGFGSAQSSALAHRQKVASLQDAAARRIQMTWINCSSRRIYESLKDTIATFNGIGEPCLLLRSVLPRESMLLDPSMQVHVRFRLGGNLFPPSIYYKIFTHGKVVDVCAFAPRDYAALRAWGCRPGDEPQGYGWYERRENNGWRPLATRFAPGHVVDDVEKQSARRVQRNFHHSRLRRQQDVDARRRAHAMNWMRKLYGIDVEDHRQLQQVTGSSQNFAAGSPAARTGAVRMAQGQAAAGDARPAAAAEPQLSIEPHPPPGPPPPQRAFRRPVSDGGPMTGSGNDGMERMPGAQAELSAQPGLPRSAPADPEALLVDDLDLDADPLETAMLLDWSQKLDFDAYMGSWRTVACTGASEGRLPIATAAC